MFDLLTTKDFDKTYVIITKGDQKLQKRVQKVFKLLRLDPFYPSLKTHKANTRNYGEKWSNRASGDVRIIWDYDSENRLIILLLDIGGHSGTHKVYK